MTKTAYQSAKSFLSLMDKARLQGTISGEPELSRAHLAQNEQRVLSALRCYARERLPIDHPVRYIATELCKTIANGALLGAMTGSLFLSSIRGTNAQDTVPPEQTAQMQIMSQKKASVFQQAEPDSAFPGNNNYGQLGYTTSTGDYDAAGFSGQGRLRLGDLSIALNGTALDGATHPSSLPRTPVEIPDVGDVQSRTHDFDLKHSFGAISLRTGNVYLFGNFGDLEKTVGTDEYSVLNWDPSSFQTNREIIDNSLESSVSAFGSGLKLGDLDSKIAYFARKFESERNDVVASRIVDTTTVPETIIFEDTTVTSSKTEQTGKGGLVSIAHPFGEFMLGADVFYNRFETEAGGVKDKDSSVRALARCRHRWLDADLGFLTNNPEGDNKFIGRLGAIFGIGEGFNLQASAGIDDFGKGWGYLGFGFFARERNQALHDFARALYDNSFDPTGDELWLSGARHAYLNGLGRQTGGVNIGTLVRRDPAQDKNRVMPFIAISPSWALLTITGDIGSSYNSAQAELYIPLSSWLTLSAGGTYTTDTDAKDLGVDDEFRVTGGLVIHEPANSR